MSVLPTGMYGDHVLIWCSWRSERALNPLGLEFHMTVIFHCGYWD